MFNLRKPSRQKPYFTNNVTIRIDRDIRISGLLARLSPQELQTLIGVLTYADRNGRCVLSGRDIAHALNLSEKQGTERLRQLSGLRFDGKPLAVDESGRRIGPGRFAKGRFRVLPLPGIRIQSQALEKLDPRLREGRGLGASALRGERAVRRLSGCGYASEEESFPLAPGETVKFPEGKSASGSSAGTVRVPSDNGVVVNYNKTTQHADDKGEVVEREKGRGEDDRVDVLELLRSRGVSETRASELVRDYPAERIRRQIEMLPFRKAREPAAMLVKAIREDWDAPAAYTAMLREKAMKREKEEAERAAEARRRARQQRIEEVMSRLSPEEMRDIANRAREAVKASLKGALDGHVPQRLVDAQVRKIISEEYSDKTDG